MDKNQFDCMGGMRKEEEHIFFLPSVTVATRGIERLAFLKQESSSYC